MHGEDLAKVALEHAARAQRDAAEAVGAAGHLWPYKTGKAGQKRENERREMGRERERDGKRERERVRKQGGPG
jgi:hypothetical protein